MNQIATLRHNSAADKRFKRIVFLASVGQVDEVVQDGWQDSEITLTRQTSGQPCR